MDVDGAEAPIGWRPCRPERESGDELPHAKDGLHGLAVAGKGIWQDRALGYRLPKMPVAYQTPLLPRFMSYP